MTLVDLLDEFCERCGSERIESDADGICRIVVDDTVVAMRECTPTVLIMWAEVGPLPQEGADRVCRRMMEGSTLGIATDGAVLTVDAETNRVLIHAFCELGVDVRDFAMALDAFMSERDKWATMLREGDTGPSGASPDDPPPLEAGDFVRV